MGDIGITEFTFGFAFLREQVEANWQGLTIAPVLPNLRQEHVQPWDAHLPTVATDYYYQFKVARYLYGGNAKHRRDGTYGTPYFSFVLNNRQHRGLKEHAADKPSTYYVAPSFKDPDVFNAAFLGRTVREEARLIGLPECDDLAPDDTTPHDISFQAGTTDFHQSSRPHRHTDSVEGRNMEECYRRDESKWRPVDREFTAQLHRDIVKSVHRALHEEGLKPGPALTAALTRDVRREAPSEMLGAAAELALGFFGLVLVLVGSP